MSNQYVLPGEIEKRSFEILTKELGDRKLLPENEPVIKRVIHTTADFDYVDNLVFSEGAVTKAVEALKAGAGIVTDTQMALSGIHKSTLESFGGTARCFMSDPEVARLAKERQTTRAWVSMEEAARLPGRWIFAIGNAPTALLRLHELILEKSGSCAGHRGSGGLCQCGGKQGRDSEGSGAVYCGPWTKGWFECSGGNL